MVSALIFAGGVGRQMKLEDIPKQFLEVEGKPIIVRTIEHFLNHQMVDKIIVVCLETWIEEFQTDAVKYNLKKIDAVLPGGDAGYQSIHIGLMEIAKSTVKDDIVLICDGVRPMLSEALITTCIQDARKFGTAVPVTPSIDSVLYSEDGSMCSKNCERKKIFITQAPQGYTMERILEAHKQAEERGIESVSSADLLLELGQEIHIFQGIRENIKVTTQEDLNSLRATRYYEHFKAFSREVLKYGKKNFQYIKTYGMSIGEAYNTAIPDIEGRYVNFSLASTWFSTGSIDTVRHFAEETGMPKLISIVPWTVNEKHESVQYKMSPKAGASSFSEDVHLFQEPDKLQLMFHAYFIRCYLINSKCRHMWFRPELFEDAPMELLCNLLAEIRGYLYLPKLKLNYTCQLEDNTSAYEHQYKEWWYLDSMKNWILPFARKWDAEDYPIRIPMRIMLYYLVFARFNCNYNDRNKGVLHGEKLETFLKLSGEVLQYVDNRLMYAKDTFRNFSVPRGMRIQFTKLKAKTAGKVSEAVVHGDRLFLWTHWKENVTDRTISAMQSGYAPKAEDLQRVRKVLDNTNTLFVVKGEQTCGRRLHRRQYSCAEQYTGYEMGI